VDVLASLAVARFRCILLAALLAGSSTQCLLYTDPINVKPEVTITEFPSASLTRKQSAHFAARAHDPDQDAASLRLTWYLGDGACPTNLDQAMTMGERQGTSATMDFTPTELGPFCAWVVVTDEHGARAFDARPGEVDNRPPTAALAVLAPPEAVGKSGVPSVALYSELRLSGAGSADPDGDALTYSWRILLPDNTTAMPDACAAPAPTDLCYVVRAPGAHRFELRVRDQATTNPAPLVQEVMVRPDAPPCVVRTDPPFDLASLAPDSREPLVFRVLEVQDDGDPLPAPAGRASDSTFVWYARPGTSGAFDRYFRSLDQLSIPAVSYQPGDVLQVRVEYRDRIKDRQLGCGDQDLFCPHAPEAPCHQMVGWTVNFR